MIKNIMIIIDLHLSITFSHRSHFEGILDLNHGKKNIRGSTKSTKIYFEEIKLKMKILLSIELIR